MNATEWGAKTEGLAISITASRQRVVSGGAIAVSISLKNFGGASVPILMRSPWLDYAYTVRAPGGALLPMLPIAEKRKESAAEGRRASRELKPGDMITDTFDLEAAFDLRHPGQYTATVQRELLNARGSAITVVSNPITFHVEPAC